jgi:hypothetical protein
MSTEQFVQRLDCFLDVIRQGRFHEIAVRDTLAEQSLRIFTHGKNSSGSLIGHYDRTRGLYVNPRRVPRGTALYPLIGKTGRDTFRSGKKHRTRYVESYARLREMMGLKADKVTLVLFGNLKSDYENGGRGTGIVPLKLDNHRFATTLDAENDRKRQRLERKYGRVFVLTKEEEKHLADVGVNELQSELDRCLQKS